MRRLECLSENPVALRAGCSGAGCRLWKRAEQSALYAGLFCDMTAQRAEALAQDGFILRFDPGQVWV